MAWNITGSQAYSEEALIRFSGLALPVGATVTGATLTLTFDNWVTGFNVRGYYLNSAWNSGPIGWLNRDTGLTWSAPGARGSGNDTIASKSFAITTFAGNGDEVKNVTLDNTVVQNWITTPSSNQGLLLINEANDLTTRIYSTESAVVSKRPKLTITYSTMAPPICVTTAAIGAWSNTTLAGAGNPSSISFDATPSSPNTDAIVGLSAGPASAFSNLATIVRFNDSGHMDARNGAGYAAAISLSYVANTTYHVRLLVDTSTHLYSIFVTPPGGSEQTLGSGFAFRSEQANVASLNNWASQVDTVGTLQVCNFVISGQPSLDTLPPTVTLTAPSQGAKVSGSIAVTATASDNVAVAGVTFLVDGIAVGAEDTSQPYSISVDTTGLSNATHRFAARARDTAGNLKTTPDVSAIVANVIAIATSPPIISPAAGTSSSPITASITCPSAGSVPYRTIDGTTPTTSSLQSNTASFATSGTLKAICAGTGYTTSQVSSASYTVTGGSGYATHGFTIPSAHPRLWWNAARLAQAQTWLAGHAFTASSNFDVAWKHAVAGTSCASAVTWAANWAPPAGQVTPLASGSDDMRWYGEDAILIFDWCNDQWSDIQKSAFIDHMNTWVGNVAQQSWGGLYGGVWMAQSNYFWGNLRNELEWGIASYGSNGSGPGSQADNFIDYSLARRWTEGFVPTTTSSAAGGSTDEGADYGATMFQYPIIPLATLGLGGRDIYDETEFFKQGVYWVVYGTTPDRTYNVNNGGTSTYTLNPFADQELFVDGGTLAQRTYYQDAMSFAANAWGALNVGKHARQWLNTVGATLAPPDRYIQAQDSETAAASYSSLPLDYYARGIKYFFGRKAWDSSSAYFMWQMGGPGTSGHNHTDIGNFNLWRGGRWLSRETTGYSNYISHYGYRTSFTQQDDTYSILAHNAVVFGTPLYAADSERLMPSVTKGQTVVQRLESQAAYSYADVDLTNQYLWSTDYTSYNMGAVGHVERELLFLRDLETTVILDRLTTGNVTQGPDIGTTAANEVTTFVIHFETNPGIEDATHVTVTNGAQALRVVTLVPSNPTRRVINEGGPVGQYRVELDTSGAAQRYFLHVLQARGASSANINASVVDSTPANPNTGTFTVTLQPPTGVSTTIVFNKGQTSNGGTVNVAGGGAAALRTTVQQISYGDNGPAWAP